MKKIFTSMLLLVAVATTAMAQFDATKEYRIKVVDGVAAGEYVTIGDNLAKPFGYVHTMALDENNADQKFTFVSSNGNWKVKSVNEEYFAHTGGTGDGWNGWNLNKTTNESSATEVIFVSTGTENEYYLRANTSQYFKVGAVDGNGSSYKHVYYDAAEAARTKFAVEEVKPIYETEEVGNPTEDGVYRVYWKKEGRGYLAYHYDYPVKPVLVDVTMSAHASKHFSSSSSSVEHDWYLITSEMGNKYLFSPYTGKFLTYSMEAADQGKGAYLDANRPQPISVEASTHTNGTGYFLLTTVIDGSKKLLSSGCGEYSSTGNPVRWAVAEGANNQLHDGGSYLTFVKVIGFPVDTAIIAQAEAAIEEYENPVEADVVFNWTQSTEWTAVEPAYYTSTVFNDSAYTNIKYIEGEITIAGARTATVTFQYTTGNCALNVRGVEVIDAKGNIVAADYHVGKAGNPSTNNVYTVKAAEAGTYKVRCYATFNDQNREGDTNGTITVAFEKLNVMDLTKEVTVTTAGYATLYLGYKVSIPAGVEAYVLTGVNPNWATLEQLHNVIPANTAVILKATTQLSASKAYNFYYTSNDADEVEINYLEGSIADRYIQGDAYVLGVVNEEVCLAPAVLNKVNNTSFKNNANKAYLKVAPGAALSTSLRFDFGGTTGIDEITENGVQSTEIYDLQGRRVSEITEKGIYIVGGKKVLVK